jgi:hypothetical protein
MIMVIWVGKLESEGVAAMINGLMRQHVTGLRTLFSLTSSLISKRHLFHDEPTLERLVELAEKSG